MGESGPPSQEIGSDPIFRRAVVWLLFLGPFFFLTYGFANWASARRTNVPTLMFAWEYHIPFLAWTIVPYWSIDLLYGISLFVCATRAELDTHAKRLLTAQVVAIACFLAFPFRLSSARPAADGLFGTLFDLLTGFDLPFNQLPSLHIALAVILWVLYESRTRGVARILLHVWFILIGASVLTTYQHHFIDLPTGFILGWLCVWLWPMPQTGHAPPLASWRTTADPARHRLSLCYGLGAAACLAIALLAGGAVLWLAWPALSLALVAAAYAGLGAPAFQKGRDGGPSCAAHWLFAPYLAGAWINSRWWTRRRPAPVHVGDDVWIGRAPSRADLAAGRFAGIVDLSAEMSLPRGVAHAVIVPVLDLTAPDAASLTRAADAIEEMRARGPVLVCCALGYSRSACAVAAWLLTSGRVTSAEAAFAHLRRAHADVALNEAHASALRSMRTA
ncbi:MAG: phosphatase PAP2/dual specificity phosphatase family protein [Burkholderiales bacterium]|nr:phosphatase PAP2/dual specificity phosphatase family protein [Burkholderiales bacterium]